MKRLSGGELSMEMIQPIRLRLHLDSRSMPTQQVMSLVFFLG